MTVQLQSKNYTVTQIKRKSAARYAKDIKIGDVLSFVLIMDNISTRYSLTFRMYVNGEYKIDVQQGELLKILGSSQSIFETSSEPSETE